jgi:hypothetical protein
LRRGRRRLANPASVRGAVSVECNEQANKGGLLDCSFLCMRDQADQIGQPRGIHIAYCNPIDVT